MTVRQFSTLIFDWGNTIMVDDGRYLGKMKDWPEVSAIHNAVETLRLLKTDNQIILATNAENSSVDDIKIALQMVQLDSYFNRIYTYSELNAKKPDKKFFINLVNMINKSTHQVVYIGDDYKRDIVGAKKAGINAIWFNPKRLKADANLPVQDEEIYDLKHLPLVLEKSFLPDVSTCIAWYLEFGATHTLLSHVINVAAIAYQLSYWLHQTGVNVNPLLTHRGGLLHDVCKLNDQEQKNHAMLAGDFLLAQNQFELSEIARRHLIGNLTSDELKPITWEEKIVNYADKLSEGNVLVSLDQRLEALQQRYPEFAEKIRKNIPFVKKLETEITDALNTSPDELMKNLKNALFNKNSHSSNGIL